MGLCRFATGVRDGGRGVAISAQRLWRWARSTTWHRVAASAAALAVVLGLLSAAGSAGLQLSPGRLGFDASHHAFGMDIDRPVGTPVVVGGSNLYNLTGSPMTVTGIAPSNCLPGVRLTAVILPVGHHGYGESLMVRPSPLHRLPLPLVNPPGSRNQYVAGLEMQTTRPEDVAIWGLDITYWWRGVLSHDFPPSSRVDCVRQDAWCTAMERAWVPLTWPAPSPMPTIHRVKSGS